jgi:beta-glucosidase
MTLEEKVRQLDLYSEATALVDKQSDSTHAAPDAAFLPGNAQRLWRNLGVGGIHDLHPTTEQANVIQEWVIEHNRWGIPALFVEEALHGFNNGTVFPAPVNLAAPGIGRSQSGPKQL